MGICKFNKGDIFYYDFGNLNYSNDHIEKKLRPAMIISNNLNNVFSTLVNIVPITTRPKGKCKEWQVYFKYNGRDQVILCEQIFTVPSNTLLEFIGHVDEFTLKEVDKALSIQFDLNTTERELDSIEFLKRMDLTIERILRDKLENNYQHSRDILHIINSFKDDQEKQINRTYSLINDQLFDFKSNVMHDIVDLKNYYKSNNNELNLILTSLIGLYENIGQNENDLSDKGVNKIINDMNKKNKTPKFEKDEDKKEQIKTKTNIQTDEYKMLHSYDIQDCLDFLKVYQTIPLKELCEIYNCSKKKLYNRNYLVKKHLDANNIEYTNINHRKGNDK